MNGAYTHINGAVEVEDRVLSDVLAPAEDISKAPHATYSISNGHRPPSREKAPTDDRYVRVNVVDGSASVSAKAKVIVLVAYFFCNLVLTLSNKGILNFLPCPFLLTASHAFFTCIGTQIGLATKFFSARKLRIADAGRLFLFSLLYTTNIAISNVSLSMVSIPFHQVVRATTPIFTVLIYLYFHNATYSRMTLLSLLPIVIGVAFSTYGDYSATISGFFMTLLGAFLASLKTVETNRMQTAGAKIPAWELLYRMSPLACVQSLFCAYLAGEFEVVKAVYASHSVGNDISILRPHVFTILGNGILAIGLNLVSFTANKKVGALTMTVSANVKQALTIGIAVLLWELKIGWLNHLGITLTLIGGAWYSRIELLQADKKRKQGEGPVLPVHQGMADGVGEKVKIDGNVQQDLQNGKH